MSLADTRQSFADAVSSVPGLTGYPYPPASPMPCDAWPQLTSISPEPLASAQWSLILVVGAGQGWEDADRCLDAYLQPLLEAFSEAELLCSAVNPAQLQNAGQPMLCAEFTVRTPYS